MMLDLLTNWSPSTMSKISRGVSASLSLKAEKTIAGHGPPVAVDEVGWISFRFLIEFFLREIQTIEALVRGRGWNSRDRQRRSSAALRTTYAGAH